jgi:antiviral helicase SKI2
VDVNAVLDKNNPEAIESTLSALQGMYESLKSGESIPEVEWTRMRQLDFQEALKARNSLADRLKSMSCQLCADFAEHVSRILSAFDFADTPFLIAVRNLA